MKKIERLMREAFNRYGPPRSIDFFGDQWRVWWTSFHEHPKQNPAVMTSDLSVHAKTLEDALEYLLNDLPKKYIIVEGSCRRGCVGYSDCCY